MLWPTSKIKVGLQPSRVQTKLLSRKQTTQVGTNPANTFYGFLKMKTVVTCVLNEHINSIARYQTYFHHNQGMILNKWLDDN